MVKGLITTSPNMFRRHSRKFGTRVGVEVYPGGRIVLTRREAEQVLLENHVRSGADGPVPSLSRVFRWGAEFLLSTGAKLWRRDRIDMQQTEPTRPYQIVGYTEEDVNLSSRVSKFWMGEEEWGC